MHSCNFCDKTFNTKETLDYHINNNKICINYRDTIFICKKCTFCTDNKKIYNEHVISCKIPINNTIDIFDLVKNFLSDNLSNKYMINLINFERLKNKIYRDIIIQNTKIKLDDIIAEQSDGIHIYNFSSDKIPVFFHDINENFIVEKVSETNPLISCIKSPAKPEIDDTFQENDRKKSPTFSDIINDLEIKQKPKKHNFRPIKNQIKKYINIIPEIDVNELHNRVTSIDNDYKQKITIFSDLEKTQEEIKNLFDKLKTSKNYTKILSEIKKHRWSIFGVLSLKDYENLLTEHISTIENILNDKKLSEKKIIEKINISLQPLEARLCRYGNYKKTYIEGEEVQRLSLTLDLHTENSKIYTPFNLTNICENINNYGMAMFTLKKNLERVLINRYGLYNIIFLPLSKNSSDDPFSFYILEKVHNQKRYWKMECRLEDISNTIITNVLPYCIYIFRTIYKDVYEDNEFRADVKNTYQITEFDCEQLIQNILILGRPKTFCNLLRKIIKEKAIMQPTENDRFDFYSDDTLQRKRFQEKEENDLVDIVKQLFDGITSEEAVDFYRSKLCIN